MGGPAGHARTGEDVGEQPPRDAQGAVKRRTEEVYVRVDLLALAIHFLTHGRLDLLGNLEPLAPLSVLLVQLLGQRFQNRSARIRRAVNAMTESHHLLTALERTADPGIGALRRPDLFEHLHHLL